MGDVGLVSCAMLAALVIPQAARAQESQEHSDNCLKNIRIHRFYLLLTVRKNKPYYANNGNDAGCDIKGKEIHGVYYNASVSLCAICAMERNATVIVMPTRKVNHGNSRGIAPGMKAPTTKEPKIIFAPSRKKFEMIRADDTMYICYADDVTVFSIPPGNIPSILIKNYRTTP